MTIESQQKIDVFRIEDTAKGEIAHYWLKLTTNALGESVRLPIMVARGTQPGPVLGLTAAVHGNELNGISVIQKLFNDLEPENMQGTIIGVPVVNLQAFFLGERKFNDGVDLNRIMPGKLGGNTSQVFAYRFINSLVKHFDYLLDLHTASFGRVNSFYIRSDMRNKTTSELAHLQDAEIIVHSEASDGTLRGAAEELGIPAITIEVGNPHRFQKRVIRSGLEGVHNVLAHLKITDDEVEEASRDTLVCKKSYWIYTNTGGLLTVHVDLVEQVEKNQHIATIKDIFGNVLEEYHAPEAGVIVGKSVNPVNQSGGRIVHLGIIEKT